MQVNITGDAPREPLSLRSWLSSLPLEELLEQTGAVSVGGGPALVEESLEIVAARRGRGGAAVPIKPFLRGREALPVRYPGREVDLAPLWMTRGFWNSSNFEKKTSTKRAIRL